MVRVGRFLDRHADVAAGAVRVVHAQWRAGAAQTPLFEAIKSVYTKGLDFVSPILGGPRSHRPYCSQVRCCSSPASAPSSCRIWMKARCGCAQPCPTPFRSTSRRRSHPRCAKYCASFPEVTTVPRNWAGPTTALIRPAFSTSSFNVDLKTLLAMDRLLSH